MKNIYMKPLNLIILACFFLLATSCSHYSTEAKIDLLLEKYKFSIQPEKEHDTAAPKFLSVKEKSVYIDSLRVIINSIKDFNEVNNFVHQEAEHRRLKDSNFIIITILYKENDFYQPPSYGVFVVITDKEEGVLLFKSDKGEHYTIRINDNQIKSFYQSINCNYFYLEPYYRNCGLDILLIYQDYNFEIVNSYLYTCVLLEDEFDYSEDFLCIVRLRNMLFDSIIYNNKRKKNMNK